MFSFIKAFKFSVSLTPLFPITNEINLVRRVSCAVSLFSPNLSNFNVLIFCGGVTVLIFVKEILIKNMEVTYHQPPSHRCPLALSHAAPPTLLLIRKPFINHGG